MSLSNNDKLSDFALNFSLEQIDQEIMKKAKLIILDSIAAMVHGNQVKEPLEFGKIISSVSTSDSQLTSIFGTHLTNLPHFSAMINALAMVSEELDEGNPIAKGHPACHFLPALLALSESEQKSGASLLESFIVGYELGARAGSAVTLKKEIHPHGSWGIIGAAFAIGKMLNYSADEYIQSMILSASFSNISLWQPVIEGHRIRDIHIGLNNLNALIIPALVKSGYSSSQNSMHEIYGNIIGEHFDAMKMSQDLGNPYLLMKTYFKFYPFCRFCHSPIDGILQIMKNEKLSPNKIKEIHVYTYSFAAKLKENNMNNEYAGKFSIPYSIAKTLLGTAVEIDSVNKFAKKISVYEDMELTQLLPSQRNSRVMVELLDGRTLKVDVEGATGDSNETALEARVIEKCKRMLSEVIGIERANRIITLTLDLENVLNTKELVCLTQP